MTRAMWKGAISFGLVHIPVELYSAVQEHDLDLHMLDRRDFSPIGFKRYNKSTGKEVAWDNIVKGYEYEDDEFVVLSDEDLRRANPEATGTIDIQAFVDAAEVPLTHYETPYNLAPGKGGAKVYALLRETLRKTGKIGIATVVIRTKQHLCALLCIDDKIVLNTLRYAAEMRSTEELKLPPKTAKAAGISDKELQMAVSLVDGMSGEWDPGQYHDTYKDDVLALVKKKIKAGQTKTITAPEKEQRETTSGNVVDLVALLQHSLDGKGKAKSAPTAQDEEKGGDEESKPAPRRAGAKSTAIKSSTSRTTASKPAAEATRAGPKRARGGARASKAASAA